ncbi:MAG: hypothetical protein GTN80_11760 [Nitrososphaeria archaeon]|nr:hypothetical protein [Nitrososphaeria archaeon]NIQ34292.1 hypothetical protein [Nitrososphaeria archaeon]
MSEAKKHGVLRAIERYFRLVLMEAYGYEKAGNVAVLALWRGEEVEVQVPKRFVGMCVGRGGDNIMKAQKDFRVKISVRSPDKT